MQINNNFKWILPSKTNKSNKVYIFHIFNRTYLEYQESRPAT